MRALVFTAILTTLLGQVTLAADLTWVKSYEVALAKAQVEGKLVLLVLDSELCPYCRQLEQETLHTPDITGQGNHFVAVKVSVVEEPELADRYARNGVPQSVFLTGEGYPVGQVSGLVPPIVLSARMEQAWASRGFPQEIEQWQQVLQQNPQEANALARLGALYVASGQFAAAEPLLHQVLTAAPRLDMATAASVQLDLLLARLPAEDGEVAPDFLAWLEENPEHDRLLEAQYHAAYALALRGEAQGSLGLWAKVRAAAPDSPYAKLAEYYSGIVRANQARRNGVNE